MDAGVIPSDFIDYDLMPEFGYDWSIAPILPVQFEYRQTFAEAHLRWLECWQPKVMH